MEKERTIMIGNRQYLGGHYPFDAIAVGERFFVPLSRASPVTVKEVVRRRNRKGRGVFWCVPAEGGMEVIRGNDETTVA